MTAGCTIESLATCLARIQRCAKLSAVVLRQPEHVSLAVYPFALGQYALVDCCLETFDFAPNQNQM